MGSKLNWFIAGAATALTAAAISQELAKPREERTWKGRVAGVPYSFRLDDWADAANEYWNPDSDKIFTEHVIGLGWGVNFAALLRRAQALVPPPTTTAGPLQPAGPPGREAATARE